MCLDLAAAARELPPRKQHLKCIVAAAAAASGLAQNPLLLPLLTHTRTHTIHVVSIVVVAVAQAICVKFRV